MNENVIDLSKIEKGYLGYASGTFQKASIVYQGENYLLKYPTRNEHPTDINQVISYMNNSFSEYIGSKIFSALGIPAQEVLLGEDKDGKLLVACKDFSKRDRGVELQEFGALAKLFYSSQEVGNDPTIETVYEVIENHYMLEGIKDAAKRRYWETMVVDALIGNYDRHAGNWGYLVDVKTGETELAPVYDCGSSLWPKMDEAYFATVMKDESQLNFLTYNLPKGRIKINDDSKRMSYIDFFRSNQFAECTESVMMIDKRMNLSKVSKVIRETPYISNQRASFYEEILERRYEKMVHESSMYLENIYA